MVDSGEEAWVRRSRTALHIAVAGGGVAALSWEMIWQLQASLALGVSALGAAITLAVTMGGMMVGSLGMGWLMRRRPVTRPIRMYGLMELIIGLSGFLLTPAFGALEQLDAAVYAASPAAAPFVHVLGIAVILGPPTLAMGATVPLFGLAAPQFRTSIALLYGLNTLGAGLGVLLVAFVVLPALGVGKGIAVIATINFAVCAVVQRLEGIVTEREDESAPVPQGPSPAARTLAVVFLTGFATFALEVAWFRSLRAAYMSTTHTFAILLAAVLLPLGFAARKMPELRARGLTIGAMLAAAGAAVLLATPAVERFDVVSRYYAFAILPSWFVQTAAVIGPAIFLLGVPLPWLLDQADGARNWARLYAVNTIGSVAGSLVSAWILLPALGFARTAWALGGLLLAAGLPLAKGRERLILGAAGAISLVVAVAGESGIGRERIIATSAKKGQYEVVAFRETPDSTVSVTDRGQHRVLHIDGFAASDSSAVSEYMVWMGRLPVILHHAPKDGLVICFGTGQTANAVRQEGIERLDLVDISGAVFEMAPLFAVNQGVLEDPRVHPIVMDGRAWLRRTSRQYDLVSLEPMPPTFAGVNALYSREFYELVDRRLRPGGIAAQWLPFHLVDAAQAAGVAATFRSVFPDSFLWIDPVGKTGILLGRKVGAPSRAPFGTEWPGLERTKTATRTLSAEQVVAARALDVAGLERFARSGEVVTDDNQLLACSWSNDPRLGNFRQSATENHARVKRAAGGDVP